MNFLLVLSLVVPIAGALLAFVVGGRWVVRIALATMPLGLAIAVAIAAELRPAGGSLVYLLGGWSPPLGVALRADWLSAVMMVTTAVVISAIGLFARADFAGRTGGNAPVLRVLDPAAGGLGRAQHRVPERRSLHLLRLAGAARLRRGSPGRPRWPGGDPAGGAALSAVRSPGLGALPRRHGPAVRRLRHARHRRAVGPHPRRAGDGRRGDADDRRA